jgi:hypothetical protein
MHLNVSELVVPPHFAQLLGMDHLLLVLYQPVSWAGRLADSDGLRSVLQHSLDVGSLA